MISVCNRTFLRSFKVCKVAWVLVPKSGSGHFRPINDVCAMSVFHPIPTKLLHYGK